jgi:hypothetical protein
LKTGSLASRDIFEGFPWLTTRRLKMVSKLRENPIGGGHLLIFETTKFPERPPGFEFRAKFIE